VRKIQPRCIHARAAHCGDYLLTIASRANGADNFCFSHRVSPLATLSFLIRSILLLEFGDNKAEIVNFLCFERFLIENLQFVMQKKRLATLF